MPIREKVLEELLEKIGARHRPKVERAISFEEDKAFEKALAEWEEIVTDMRREGKDVSVLQDHLKRFHQLWWQRGGPKGRDPLAEPSARGASSGEKTRDKDEGKSFAELKTALRTEL